MVQFGATGRLVVRWRMRARPSVHPLKSSAGMAAPASLRDRAASFTEQLELSPRIDKEKLRLQLRNAFIEEFTLWEK